MWRWLENVALVGFILVNVIGVFAVLWWGLGKNKQPAPREHQDQGAMTAGGVPYVPGPQQSDPS